MNTCRSCPAPLPDAPHPHRYCPACLRARAAARMRARYQRTKRLGRPPEPDLPAAEIERRIAAHLASLGWASARRVIEGRG